MKRSLGRGGLLLVSVWLMLAAVQCGNNGGGNVVAIAITAPTTAQTVAVNGTLALTAAVTNTSNKDVSWTVNGVTNGNATYGTITGSGLSVVYHAPAAVPSTATFNITVTSAADTSKSASISVTISPGVGISITAPSTPQTLSVSSTLNFTADVTGTSDTSVNWTVNGVANGNATFGTITGTGLSVTYTAPPTVPTPATFNVTATSGADTSKSASVSVTVTPGIGITITTPATLAVNVPAQSSLGLTASVLGTANTAVTWAVNGLTNGNPTLGTIIGTGLSVTFDAPTAIPSPATYNITVTSQADPTKSASLSVTITAAVPLACGSGNESILTGQYAFLLKGFDHNGFRGVVGSITADGLGHITAGEVDINSTGAATETQSTITASPTSFYSVGPDNRGCATIVTTSGTTLKTRFDLRALSLNSATQGQIMEFDTANSGAFVSTGRIFQQNPSNFIVLEGGAYVHLFTGWDSVKPGRIVCGGIHTNSGGNISATEETCNDGGTVATTGPTLGSTGSYTGMDSNGRFTETVNSATFVSYFVTQNTRPSVPAVLSLSTDTNPVMAGESTFQTQNTYSQSSLVGDYVIYASGVKSSTSGKIFLAAATSDGANKLTLNSYDENDGGVWKPTTSPVYTYSVDFLGGVSFTTPGPVNAGQLYLTGGPFAVYVGADSGGFAGAAVLQPGSGSFTNATLQGTYFGGSAEVVNQAALAELDIEGLNGAGGVLIATDGSSTGNQTAAQLSAQTIAIAPRGAFASTDLPTQAIGIAVSPNFFVGTSNTTAAYPNVLWLTLDVPPIS